MRTGLTAIVFGLLISLVRCQLGGLMEGVGTGNPMMDMMLMSRMLNGGSGGGGGGSGSGGGGELSSGMGLMLASGGVGMDMLPLLMAMRGSGGGEARGAGQSLQAMTPPSAGYAQMIARMLGDSGSGITAVQQQSLLAVARSRNKMSTIMDAVRSMSDRTQLEITGLGILQGVMRFLPAFCPAPRSCPPVFGCEMEIPYTPESFYACNGCPRCRMESQQRMFNTMRMAHSASGGAMSGMGAGMPGMAGMAGMPMAALAGMNPGQMDPMMMLAMQQLNQQPQQQPQSPQPTPQVGPQRPGAFGNAGPLLPQGRPTAPQLPSAAPAAPTARAMTPGQQPVQYQPPPMMPPSAPSGAPQTGPPQGAPNKFQPPPSLPPKQPPSQPPTSGPGQSQSGPSAQTMPTMPKMPPYFPQPPAGPPPQGFIEAMRQVGRQLQQARGQSMTGPPRPPRS